MTETKTKPAMQDDIRTLVKLAIWAGVILCAAAVLGLAVRVFVIASGFGG